MGRSTQDRRTPCTGPALFKSTARRSEREITLYLVKHRNDRPGMARGANAPFSAALVPSLTIGRKSKPSTRAAATTRWIETRDDAAQGTAANQKMRIPWTKKAMRVLVIGNGQQNA